MSAPPKAFLDRVRGARAQLAPHLQPTPTRRSDALSALGGGDVHLKLECWQPTGSFKIRGALHRILSLSDAERERGVVTASSGNHGLAVAWALRRLGARGEVVVPRGASPTKVDAIRRCGAELLVHGDDCADTESWARRHAEESGAVYLSPYNDPVLVAGQGTCGLELIEQLDGLDVLYVTVGGGGLISGIGGVLEALAPSVELVGCSPAASAVMAASVRAGRVLELESLPTLSDGSAGGLEPGTITLERCQRLVHRWVEVSEESIAQAMRLVIGAEHVLVEGAAGVAVAAWYGERERQAGRRVGIVLCGSNVASEVLQQVLAAP